MMRYVQLLLPFSQFKEFCAEIREDGMRRYRDCMDVLKTWRIATEKLGLCFSDHDSLLQRMGRVMLHDVDNARHAVVMESLRLYSDFVQPEYDRRTEESISAFVDCLRRGLMKSQN